MKQYNQYGAPVPPFSVWPVFIPLTVLFMTTPQNLVRCDDMLEPSSSGSVTWAGSALVDSDQGSSLHLRLAYEDTRTALDDLAIAASLIHPTAGTAGFPGLSPEALDDVSFGLNLDSQWLVAGDLGLAGLSSFLFRPAGAGPLLTRYGRKPLKAERPDGTRYRGFVLGKEGGLMAVQPASEPARLVSGAWFSPLGSPVSVMMLAGSEPGQLSDDWYEPDRIPTERLWGAASLGMDGKGKLYRMSASGAFAATAGLPGEDGMAGRLEAMLAVRRLRIDAEASLTSDGWRAPDGVTSVPAQLDLSTLYRNRGLELSGTYRQVLKDASDEGPETGLRAHVQLSDGKRDFRLASTLNQAGGQSIPAITLDTRCRPGLLPAPLPDLVLETSWKAEDGISERFDIGASLKGGRTLSWDLYAGLRYDKLGRHLKGTTSILVPLGGNSLRFGIRSNGWIPLAGKQPADPLVLTIGWCFSSP
ncbi:MAG: hypothetical protein AB7T74_12555 [Clostridia bacterium]